MLEFKPVQIRSAARLRKYYEGCTYRLCEYSVGVKLMWRERLRPWYAEAHGCLIVLNQSRQGYIFDYPVPLPGEGDVDAALGEIDAWCMEKGVAPVFGVAPEEERDVLLDRYPSLRLESSRVWQDYLYRAEDLASFAGRRYSGQRNHINKFRKLYPTAVFRPLTEADGEALEAFWEEFHRDFHKESAEAKREACSARKLTGQIGRQRWIKAGAMELDGRFIAISLGEICGNTLVCHIEKGLSGYEGVYPAIVQAFAACFGEGLTWINREDDAGDRGLRTSKLQYLPAAMGVKLQATVYSELENLKEIPVLKSERLILDGLREGDRAAYNRLCLDDERNRWWGYDYREDLKGELTADYFLEVARRDFANRLAVNFAVRLGEELIGEAVLYRFDYKGQAELGCRILPEYAGSGYGREAFQTAAEWSLYSLGLRRLTAKCYHENLASAKMLESCMRPCGEDETFRYFEKKV